MDPARHARGSQWQSIILIISMVGVLSVCDFALLGWTGLLFAFALTAGIVMATGRASAAVVLRM